MSKETAKMRGKDRKFAILIWGLVAIKEEFGHYKPKGHEMSPSEIVDYALGVYFASVKKGKKRPTLNNPTEAVDNQSGLGYNRK